jgi:hypothetical protein
VRQELLYYFLLIQKKLPIQELQTIVFHKQIKIVKKDDGFVEVTNPSIRASIFEGPEIRIGTAYFPTARGNDINMNTKDLHPINVLDAVDHMDPYWIH